MIHSGFLIQALRRGGAVHRCINCGERMFVKYASGLCPLCYNGRRELRLDEPVHVAAMRSSWRESSTIRPSRWFPTRAQELPPSRLAAALPSLAAWRSI